MFEFLKNKQKNKKILYPNILKISNILGFFSYLDKNQEVISFVVEPITREKDIEKIDGSKEKIKIVGIKIEIEI